MLKIINKKDYENKNRELIELRHRNEVLYSDYKKMEERVKEVEDAYTKKSGLQVRLETTKVYAKFSKLELVVMMSGVMKLAHSSSSLSDIEEYTRIVKKIQGYIDGMSDDD